MGASASLKKRAAETERLGQIHPDTVKDFHDSRLWRVHQPERYGGLELDFTLYIDIGEALGRGCGSTAWVWANLVAHDWMLGMFPIKAQDEIWHEDQIRLSVRPSSIPVEKLKLSMAVTALAGVGPFPMVLRPAIGRC